MLFCTNCGTPTGGEGKRLCTKCGAVLPEDPSADTTQTAVTSTPPPLPPDQQAIPPNQQVIPPDQQATVTAQPFAVPPVPAAPEHPPTYVSPPGSWPPAQSDAPGYDAPAGSWPAGQAPSYDAPAGSWPPGQAPSYDAPAGSWPPGQAPGYDPTGPGAWPPSQPQDVPPPGPPRPPGPPDRQPRSNHTAAWIGFAVAAILVLAGGGFAAWKFLGHSNNHSAAAGSSTGAANQTGS